MALSITRLGFAFALLLAPVCAQDAPTKTDPSPTKKDEQGKEAAAGAEKQQPADRLRNGKRNEEVKLLKPQDMAAELMRLKSKADIKAEVTILPLHGRQVIVKGVIRNGKLIERFQGRRFRSEKNIDHSHAGVRLWWVNNTAGWIFLRYSQVRTIALTGALTAEERRQIMEALKASKTDKKTGAENPAEDGDKLEQALKKMSPTELEGYVLRQYPADKGWNHEKLRKLKRRQIINNETLDRGDAIFVRYFGILIKARLKELKRATKKIEFEPGSDENKPESGKSGDSGSKPVPEDD